MKECKGLIFDIQRFALHDGKGIRTTVFLKGCPLSCAWCHNPEGIESEQKLVWRKKRCMKCGECTRHLDGFSWKKEQLFFDPKTEQSDQAIRCCPTGALTLDSKWYTPQALLEEIKKDQAFFKYGGGVTFSGGEPLKQKEYLKEVLILCKKEGIHTSIETSLQTDLNTVKDIFPLLDQIYFDLKTTDPLRHQNFTGTQNRQILENAAWTLQANLKAEVTVRTPLIPGYTATKENIEEIASFLASIKPDIPYELLPYNPLAGSKYELAGKQFSLFPHTQKQSPQEMEEWRALAQAQGLTHVIVSN